MARLYIDDPQKLADLALSGVQATCQWNKEGEGWPDRIFARLQDGADPEMLCHRYAQDLKDTLVFYVETE